ncbi:MULTISPECIES: hypothetical protein [unclassified Streptomyces]|uniref:hypothetical protein n=1 Tax=unclassified Streptomyces TaxID=2593676 RepID=UPI0038151D91
MREPGPPGLSARFCHPHGTEQATVGTGAPRRPAGESWEICSAAYAPGRVLRPGGERYGTYYEQNVLAHGLLAEGGGTPWRTIPWR